MEWLNFISTESHKSFGALFNPDITPAHKEYQLALIGKRCDLLKQQRVLTPLPKRGYLPKIKIVRFRRI